MPLETLKYNTIKLFFKADHQSIEINNISKSYSKYGFHRVVRKCVS